MKNKILEYKGITLIGLIVTIIILLILAGISIAQLTGNGLFEKAKLAKEETQKKAATEKMTIKITTAQIQAYEEKKEMASLEDLYNYLKIDEDMEYVETQSKKTGDTENTFAGIEYIYTKLKEYPYEFGINTNLQLASINGVQIATNENNKTEENKNNNTKTELFSSESGSYGTDITLTDSYKNYTKIEIYYKSVINTAFITPYQSVVVDVAQLSNQDNFIVLGGYGKNSNNKYFDITGYYFEENNDRNLKFYDTYRIRDDAIVDYRNDQLWILKIFGYKEN